MAREPIFGRRRSAYCLAALLLLASSVWAAVTAPRVPCGGDAPVPAPSGTTAEPRVESWTNVEWQPPPCLPWEAGKYRFIAVIAGPLAIADAGELLGRLGAISTTTGMRYWSESEDAWRVMIENATALAGDGREPRADFTRDEMLAGAPLYFRDKDNRSANPITYRMRVLKASEDEVIVESANVTPIEVLGFTLLPPGSFRIAHVARRAPGGPWSLYLVSSADSRASRLIAVVNESFTHRAMAVFAHVTSVPSASPR